METPPLPIKAHLTASLTPLDVEVVLSVLSGAPQRSECLRIGITEGRYRHRYFTALRRLRTAANK
jgi:hypothetical protein